RRGKRTEFIRITREAADNFVRWSGTRPGTSSRWRSNARQRRWCRRTGDHQRPFSHRSYVTIDHESLLLLEVPHCSSCRSIENAGHLELGDDNLVQCLLNPLYVNCVLTNGFAKLCL